MDENNRMNNQGTASGEQPAYQSQSSGTGSLVGAIIIILLLAFGAFYFWGAKLNTGGNNPPPLILGNETADAESSDASAGLPPQQTSDDAAAIEADLQAMNIGQLDAENATNLQGFQGETP